MVEKIAYMVAIIVSVVYYRSGCKNCFYSVVEHIAYMVAITVSEAYSVGKNSLHMVEILVSLVY